MDKHNNTTGMLDEEGEDTIRMTVDDARALGEGALRGFGYPQEEARIITDQLIENALCGYRFASLPRILAIVEDKKTKEPRRPISIVKESPVSALVDGGNNVGYLAAYRGAEIAIEKARRSGIGVVGVYDSYYSGRNAYFVELVTKAGFVCIHTASAQPRVLPAGGKRPALGTNPLSIGFPGKHESVVYDIGTASMMWGEVMLHAHLGWPIPEGIGFDGDGNPSTDAKKVLEGGVVPIAGHKGYGLSFAIQALGILAGARKAKGQVRDYSFLFIAIDPSIMLDEGDFEEQLEEMVAAIKATPRRDGVDEIRIPSERAFRERALRREQGIVLDRKVVESLGALRDGHQ